MSNTLIELGLASEDVDQPRKQTPRDPTRLQVATYYDNAATDALDELGTWAKMWGNYYDPAVLKAAIVALQSVKDLVNR